MYNMGGYGGGMNMGQMGMGGMNMGMNSGMGGHQGFRYQWGIFI